MEQVEEEAKAESSSCGGVATRIAEVGGTAPWLDVVTEEVGSWVRIRQFEVGHDGHIDQVDEPIVVEPLPRARHQPYDHASQELLAATQMGLERPELPSSWTRPGLSSRNSRRRKGEVQGWLLVEHLSHHDECKAYQAYEDVLQVDGSTG